jgi:hypothetical protein
MIDSVKIGAIRYAVSLVGDLRNGKRKLDGNINYTNTSIRLEADMDPQAHTQVLLHEILHGICMQGGLNIFEGHIDVLAFGVYQVLRDNPQLVEMIVKDDNK